MNLPEKEMLSYGWKSDGQRGWTLQKYENNVNAQIESLHFFFTAMQGYPWCGDVSRNALPWERLSFASNGIVVCFKLRAYINNLRCVG